MKNNEIAEELKLANDMANKLIGATRLPDSILNESLNVKLQYLYNFTIEQNSLIRQFVSNFKKL